MFSEHALLLEGRSDPKSIVENCCIESRGKMFIRDEDVLMVRDCRQIQNKIGNIEKDSCLPAQTSTS